MHYPVQKWDDWDSFRSNSSQFCVKCCLGTEMQMDSFFNDPSREHRLQEPQQQ